MWENNTYVEGERGQAGVRIAMGEPGQWEGFSWMGDEFLFQEGESSSPSALILLITESPWSYIKEADIIYT